MFPRSDWTLKEKNAWYELGRSLLSKNPYLITNPSDKAHYDLTTQRNNNCSRLLWLSIPVYYHVEMWRTAHPSHRFAQGALAYPRSIPLLALLFNMFVAYKSAMIRNQICDAYLRHYSQE